MTAIVAEGISKKFRLSQSRGTVKDRLFGRGNGGSHQDFWALQPLDLTIEEGTTVGILGHNGSGKSTLLKCIAGILKPTTGTVQVKGRVASLLELGAGFHPDLTGRENVFINAAFLGISQKEIARRFDDIVDFAELHEFIDQQVKYYSSGMFVRLGFAVAVNMDPDVLLVDEVLAVGDEVFQQKCLDRVEDFQREGRTILFVTHAADLVRRICTRAVVLHHGEMVAHGLPGESIRIFREHLHGRMEDTVTDELRLAAAALPVHFTSVNLAHPNVADRAYLLPGEPLTIEIAYEAAEPIVDSVIALEIRDQRGELIHAVSSDLIGVPLPTLAPSGVLRLEFDGIPLLDGRYPFNVQLRHHHDGTVIGQRENLDAFEVMNPGRQSGIVDLRVRISTGADALPYDHSR